MDKETAVTIKRVKDMGNDISAWQSRLAGLKSDVENLRFVKEQSEKDIHTMQNAATQDIAQRLLKARQEQSIVDESRNKLESDKKDFAELLKDFQKDKNAVERMKSDLEGAKNEYLTRTEKMRAFITLVKREAEGL